ncbi:MAG TPA: lipoyl(octanoyl) transferase LipB [Candidatus Thioglobus sp.]|nr:lipoyl(octanoyl) transferase LipB [Candidatus Thioglobus sp.]HIL21383.1 lipoyl(octanoyl) transferase LipB [Candidatus Thioglobus sp.]
MIKVCDKGVQDYETCWRAMVSFTEDRDESTPDELWIVEHNPVLTQGLSGKAEHLLSATDIPIVHSDRGGQITYHGPGQLVIYCLIDIKRLGIGVKKIVSIIEQSIIDLLHDYKIQAKRKPGAPGVYVDDDKIAALGLKIKKGRTYHGLSLNIDMDLKPFKLINPCGYVNLKVTQMQDLVDNTIFLNTIKKQLTRHLIDHVTRR